MLFIAVQQYVKKYYCTRLVGGLMHVTLGHQTHMFQTLSGHYSTHSNILKQLIYIDKPRNTKSE